MTHICPACGKEWECECTPEVIAQHVVELHGHWEEICCSEKCAKHMRALAKFFSRYGV